VPFQVQHNEKLGVRAVFIRVGMKTGRLQDGELRDVAALLLGGQAINMLRTNRYAGAFGDDADWQAIIWMAQAVVSCTKTSRPWK